jgi:hypothetical protein
MAPLEFSLSAPAEFLATDVAVQVDLPEAIASAAELLAAATLVEQLPEVVKLVEPPLLEEMLHVLAFATCVEVGVKALGVRNIAATKIAIPLIRNNWFMFVIITRTIKIHWNTLQELGVIHFPTIRSNKLTSLLVASHLQHELLQP